MAVNRDKAMVVAEAKQRIAECFDGLAIFQRERGQALYHYCAVPEVEAFKAAGKPTVYFAVHRDAVESSFHAIPGIMQRCQKAGKSQPQMDQDVFAEAYELFQFSRRRESVEHNLQLAEKGQFDVFVAKRDPRITFVYADSAADSADTLLRTYGVDEAMGIQHSSDSRCRTTSVGRRDDSPAAMATYCSPSIS
jgi:hypothetical protein